MQNPKLLDWFKILSQDRTTFETLKLKQQHKDNKKIIKGLQKQLSQQQKQDALKRQQLQEYKVSAQ